MEVYPRQAHSPFHRVKAVPGVEVGGVRAQRRAAMGADLHGRRQLLARLILTGGFSRQYSAAGVFRQVRPDNHDAERY